MSYYIGNFGAFGGALADFADLNGYVPQMGDAPDDLQWDAMVEWSDDSWQEFVKDAVAATAAAEAALNEWRSENNF